LFNDQAKFSSFDKTNTPRTSFNITPRTASFNITTPRIKPNNKIFKLKVEKFVSPRERLASLIEPSETDALS